MNEEEKKEEIKENSQEAQEPSINYGKRTIRIYKSFEEQAEEELKYMASLSPLETLMEMRKMINLAYGLHGFDPNNIPKKHSIKLVSYKGKMF